jgi:hypothetical protein
MSAPKGLRPFKAVRDELGADSFLRELQAGRWLAFWYESDSGEYHDLGPAHWHDGRLASSSMQHGSFSDGRDKKWLPRPRPIWVRPATQSEMSSSKHAGGAPTKYDWEGALIATLKHVYDNGLPKTQAELEKVMRDWFTENNPSGGPDDSGIKPRVRRIFKAFRSSGHN